MSRTCKVCKQTKEIDNYAKYKQRNKREDNTIESEVKWRWRWKCKSCINASRLDYMRVYRKTHKRPKKIKEPAKEETHRTCRKCNIRKEIKVFVKQGVGKNGRRSRCTMCVSEYAKQRYIERKKEKLDRLASLENNIRYGLLGDELIRETNIALKKQRDGEEEEAKRLLNKSKKSTACIRARTKVKQIK